MKIKYLLLLLSIISLSIYSGCASSKQATQEEMKHEYVKEFPNISKDEIFERTMKWISKNFKSAKSVIDYQDKQAGTIVAKGIIPSINLGGLFDANLGFTLTIDARDQKAKFSYDNLIPIDPTNGDELSGMTGFERVHKNAAVEFDKITNNLSTAILTKTDF